MFFMLYSRPVTPRRREHGGHGPPPTFLCRKRKNGNKGQNTKDFKAETIKRLLLRLSHTVLAILVRLEFKNFSFRPTMVADNTFQCSLAPPL